jgi:glycosyltransferase involved in cell wall biosynthesis
LYGLGVRFTIITSTLNCAQALAATASSLRAQSYRRFQWIIADGDSEDGTVEVIRSHSDVVSDWFSRPDRGIYDAWNKACQLIAGDWVLFLGAGDLLAHADTLQRMAAVLANVPAETVIAYGNVEQRSGNQQLYRYGQIVPGSWELHRPALPARQGVFQRSKLLAVDEPFDVSYKVAADSKFLLQATRLNDMHYVNIDICHMEPGGVSADPRHALKVMREALRLQRETGYPMPLARRTWFVFRTIGKHLVFRLLGRQAVTWMARR